METSQESAGVGLKQRPAESPEQHQLRIKEPEAAAPIKRRRTLPFVLLLLVLGGVGMVIYSRWQTGQALPEGLLQVNGRIEGDSVTIASKFAGRIGQLLAREGDTVTQGQALVQIEDAQIREQLNQAKANLQIALAQGQGADTGIALTEATTSAQILQAQGLVRQAESGISGANADLARAAAAIPNAP